MKIITMRDVIRGVPGRWDETYSKHYGTSYRTFYGDPQETSKRLHALNLDTCSSVDVDAVIGNDSWTRSACDECGANQVTLCHIGDEPDYEARYQQLCVDCLRAAVELFDRVRT